MYAPQRSCRYDLECGMGDGSFKKAAPNRGGQVEPTFARYRSQMSGVWHGYNELPVRVLGDGTVEHDKHNFPIRAQDMENV